MTQFRATLGKAGTWLTAWGHAGPGQASLGARAVPHVSRTPARSLYELLQHLVLIPRVIAARRKAA